MMKELSLFNGEKIFAVKRDRLFYDKYEWSISWVQSEITVLRSGTSVKKVSQAQADREYWSKYRYGTMSVNWHSPFTAKVTADIESVRMLLANEAQPWKTVFGYSNNITVYTSNPGLIKAILSLAINTTTIRQALVTRPRDTLELVDPKFKFRTYLRSTLVNEDSKTIVSKWIKAQGDAVRPGPSLAHWLRTPTPAWKVKWDGTERYYFFDHDSKMYETMLSMVLPSSVRKTVELIKKQ